MFLALDLFQFFVMFEIVLVPMYFLIGGWGYDKRVYAANKFFLYTMLGSAFMLVSIVSLAFLHQQGVGGELTFDLLEIADDPGIAQDTARWIFLGLAVAFAVKVPLFPVHTWLPDAHTQAPDGRLGHPRRRHAQARHLRLPAPRRVPAPRGRPLVGAAVPHPRRRRDRLRRRRRHDADATSSAWSPTPRSPTSASSCSARSP